MKSEYQDHLDYYSNKALSWFSVLTSNEEWGDKNSANLYLDKYWLPYKDFQNKWEKYLNAIFSSNFDIANLFKNNFFTLSIPGGSFFIEKDFNKLRRFLLEIGEEELILVENTFGANQYQPAFRMKFPASITWKELTSGNFISSTILEDINKEYYLFGSIPHWGAYVATHDSDPVNIIGVEQKLDKTLRIVFNN